MIFYNLRIWQMSNELLQILWKAKETSPNYISKNWEIKDNFNIAICWATWAVWQEMIMCLEKIWIPVNQLKLLASWHSAGKKIDTAFGGLIVEELRKESFEWVDFALFSAGSDISKSFAKYAINSWSIVIDNSSAFRYIDEVPLVVPEINSNVIGDSRLIANPNCTTAIAAVVLYPIHKKYKILKLIMSTYQATSWAWAKGMEELLTATKWYFSWIRDFKDFFVHPIAFNLIPHIDSFQENWYTKEEMKVSWETQKIFWDDSLKISCTAVRVPILRAHSESITIETQEDIDIEDLKNLLKNSEWVELVDNLEKKEYPMPFTSTWKFDVEVWRIRESLIFWKKWVDLFVSWDQLLRWAASNAVLIMKAIIDNFSK